jgi:2-methylcitrate dehydratase PrpD
LWNQTFGGRVFDLPIPQRFEGHTFAVQQSWIKSFPTRFNCQVPVFAAQKLRAMADPARIASAQDRGDPPGVRSAGWTSPRSGSRRPARPRITRLPCTVAMALLDGTITPQMMEGNVTAMRDVLDLMQKCTIELPDEFERLAPQTRCCRLTATLDTGETVVAEFRRSLADDAADPGWTQATSTSSEQLTRDLLERSARERLVALVDGLEQQGRIDELIALTRLRSGA